MTKEPDADLLPEDPGGGGAARRPGSQWPGWVVLICFLAIIVGIGVGTNAWRRELNPDEAKYYAPAIRYVVQALPHLPLRDYPFPGPPLGLWVQAIIAAAFGSPLGVRLFSSICALALAACLILHPGRKSRLPLAGALTLLTFPFFLWNAFTIKEHVLTAGCVLLGLECWCDAEEAPSGRGLGASGLFLSLATLTNQFCAPLCATLFLERAWRLRRAPRNNWAPLACAGAPLLCLGLLMLAWGGKQPPAFTDPLPAEISIGWRSRLAQLVLGLICAGAWPGALCFQQRRHLKLFLIAWLPAMLLVWLSGLYSAAGSFWTTGQGPISKLLSIVCRQNSWLTIPASGALAAIAVAFWIRPELEAPWRNRTRILIALFLAVTTLAVPYLFESYYLLLVLPLLFVVLRNGSIHATERKRVLIHLGAMILGGIAYAVFKLRQLG